MRNFLSFCMLGLVLFACSPASEAPSSPEDAQIEALLQNMTLTEKIGQLNQRGTSSRERGISDALKAGVREGR
ncbi:MAG TPA: hypothetical protein DCR93_10765, partial [Cytophagales bacterium]|nr:hypothetical protein [Cytophagales bacterium]